MYRWREAVAGLFLLLRGAKSVLEKTETVGPCQRRHLTQQLAVVAVAAVCA